MWACLNEAFFGRHWRVLTFRKNISLGLRLQYLCLYGSYRQYAQTACNTPRTKENMKSHHMTLLNNKYIFLYGFICCNNLVSGINQGKREVKTYLLRQPCHFSFRLKVFELFYHDLCLTDSSSSPLRHKHNTLPGVLLSKFTTWNTIYMELAMWCKHQNILHVCVCVCIYIYIYIYIHSTSLTRINRVFIGWKYYIS